MVFSPPASCFRSPSLAWSHISRGIATIAANDQQMVGTVTLLRERAKKVLGTPMNWSSSRLTGSSRGCRGRLSPDLKSLHQQLNQLDRQLPQVGGILVVAPDGTIANSSGPMPAEPINVSDSDYFTALRDGYQGAYIGSVHRDRAAGAERFNCAAPFIAGWSLRRCHRHIGQAGLFR